MAGVEANPQALVAAERVEDDDELVERPADRPACTRRVLHQHPGAVVGAVKNLLDRRHDPFQPGLEASTEVGADMENDAVRVDGAGRVDRRPHRLHALAVDVVVGRSEVDEVEGMHERLDACLLAFRAKGREIRWIVVREAPGARALDEELHGLSAHVGALGERLLDPS